MSTCFHLAMLVFFPFPLQHFDTKDVFLGLRMAITVLLFLVLSSRVRNTRIMLNSLFSFLLVWEICEPVLFTDEKYFG